MREIIRDSVGDDVDLLVVFRQGKILSVQLSAPDWPGVLELAFSYELWQSWTREYKVIMIKEAVAKKLGEHA